jgi:hypothetical protein
LQHDTVDAQRARVVVVDDPQDAKAHKQKHAPSGAALHHHLRLELADFSVARQLLRIGARRGVREVGLQGAHLHRQGSLLRRRG